MHFPDESPDMPDALQELSEDKMLSSAIAITVTAREVKFVPGVLGAVKTHTYGSQ